MTQTTDGPDTEIEKAAIIHETRTDRANTSGWIKVAFAGSLTMAVWSLALQALAGFIPPVAVIGIIFATFAVFLRGDRPRLGLVAAVLAAVAVLGNIPIILDDLSNPDSAPTFILNLLSLVGVSLIVIGGVAGFRRSSTDRIGAVARLAPAVLIIGALASLLIASNTTSVAAEISDVEVVAAGVAWEPGEITVESDHGVWIDNHDGIRHTFAIEGTDIELEIAALKSNRIDLDLAPGTYRIICTVPGHESMTGTLTVSP